MAEYAQQRLYQIELSFHGPWAKPYNTPANVLKTGGLITLAFPAFSTTVTTPSRIFAQLPGDLYPLAQSGGFTFDEVSWTALGIANNTGVNITISINSTGLLTIGNGVAGFVNDTNTFTTGNSGFESQALTYILANGFN